MQRIAPAGLAAWLDDTARPAPLLLDVREAWEFDLCHIEGARLVPMHELVARVGELDPTRATVLICHHGVRSRRVAQYLEQQGFAQVINLSGGMAQWAEEVAPTMARY